jgi:hypothetical protein
MGLVETFGRHVLALLDLIYIGLVEMAAGSGKYRTSLCRMLSI